MRLYKLHSQNTKDSWISVQLTLMVGCLSFCLSACFPIANLQSGRTIGKDSLEFALSTSLIEYPNASNTGKLYLPGIEARLSYGLTKRIDAGLRLNSAAFIAPSLKLQFLGSETSLFASSIGWEGGVNPAPFLLGRALYYTTFPLYISVHPKENISFHFTPRHIYTFDFLHPDISGPDSPPDIANFYGYSYGFMTGRRIKFGFDISSFRKTGLSLLPSQISIGLLIPFNPKDLP